VSLDSTVEAECRALLGSAGTMIYSNILRLHPNFNHTDVLDDLAAPLYDALTAKVRKAVRALQKAFNKTDLPAAPEGPSGGASDSTSSSSSDAAVEDVTP
jgi:hypothetical protein